jgi:hypothetical protein
MKEERIKIFLPFCLILREKQRSLAGFQQFHEKNIIKKIVDAPAHQIMKDNPRMRNFF